MYTLNPVLCYNTNVMTAFPKTCCNKRQQQEQKYT